MYTREGYEHLLQLLIRGGYSFKSFLDDVGSNAQVVYLRHDIDYSVDMAVAFAEINQKMNVQGTFFFQLRSGVYNFLSRETLAKVRRIHSLGQYVGMHFALPPEIPEDQPLKAMIVEDFEVMQAQIPEMLPVFGWHNPLTYPGYYVGLDLNRWGLELPGFCNVYSARFIKEIPYFSDSNIRYSFEELEKICQQVHPKIQLLLHPFQWVSEGKNMLDVLAKTWKTIIREREETIVNAVYGKQFPKGMPEEYLEQFAERLVSAHPQKCN